VPPPQAFLSWSSGKDAAFALSEARRLGLAEVVGLLTTVNTTHQRVAMHGLRRSVLARQAAEVGLPLLEIPIPHPCSNQEYDARMAEATARLRAQGVRHVVFGDLYLEDIRAYREERLHAVGMEAIFPLWQRPTRALAAEMLAAGMAARIVCLDPRKLDRRFSGRLWDAALIAELPAEVDPCGENGEFHTAVLAGPMFAHPIAARVGEVVERGGFVFADLIEEQAEAAS